MSYLEEHFPDYDCDEFGNVYKDGVPAKTWLSGGYVDVLLFDKEHKHYVKGVHCVVAMKYLDYKDGCVVHHKDHNKQNNNLDNLEVINSISEHVKMHHSEGLYTSDMYVSKTAWNKGKKMDDEFKNKVSLGMKRYYANLKK